MALTATNLPIENKIKRVFVIPATLSMVFYVGVILVALLFFRSQMRLQMTDRTGDLITRFSQWLLLDETQWLDPDGVLIDLALQASELEGTIGLRLYHPLDQLVQTIPGDLLATQLAATDHRQLLTGKPLVRFYPRFPLTDLFSDHFLPGPADVSGFPIIEILTPLNHPQLSGTAAIQYWLDGSDLAAAFAQLDRTLIRIGSTLLLVGFGVYFALFFAARKRLGRMAGQLSERNASLEKANRELSLMARSAAIGSVTSHLFHGLKNPLAGLKSYLRLTSGDHEAVAMADRMQSLVNETLGVLRDASASSHDSPRISLKEFAESLQARMQPIAQAAACKMAISTNGDGHLEMAKAQLLLLILRNMIDNAIDASPANATVNIDIHATSENFHIRVADSGSGIPKDQQAHLFEPGSSTKPNGSGLGLAISAIMARHIGANLHLLHSSHNGSIFAIDLPSSLSG